MIAQPSREIRELASQTRGSLAGNNLTPLFAKLYSQYTRLREGQPGLSGWRENEAKSRLNDAVHLLEASIIEREAGIAEWTQGARRAGELLEWLSDPNLSPFNLPTELFSAAVYQIAGYPARAFGLLNSKPARIEESRILRFLLGGDFPNLFLSLTEYWGDLRDGNGVEPINSVLSWHDQESLSIELNQWILRELASSVGVLCSQMRWGNESRIESALDKFSTISKFMLHAVDPYSWLLAKLCSEVAIIYKANSFRNNLGELADGFSTEGKSALERYIRLYYHLGRTQIWPSQLRGITRLIEDDSFALCTPTGSGKTTVAEIAVLQSLFPRELHDRQIDGREHSPIVIYLVPSRALAAEVEAKLSQVLYRIAGQSSITVTGLYGGTDWGPTDAWLTNEERIVLICTYEKAEALLRFLGPPFLNRISLVIIDEAHLVQFDGEWHGLQNAESRSLRLEVLGTRLLSQVDNGRFIALSAMAASVKRPLARWIAGDASEEPEAIPYRSTRQLIGRLECLPNRRFEIQYDLLDEASLAFQEEGRTDRPYIPHPFPPHPLAEDWESEGPEKRLRPYLFWSAIHLASPDDIGHQRSVLISITQQIGGFAADLLKLLESTWVNQELPIFFTPPDDPGKQDLWDRCLRACEDYFTRDSREYKLLTHGVIVHHGSMPGTLARLLVKIIQNRIVHLVMATSTLSEGVNLPFETILVPNLRRWPGDMTVAEFGNLAGRAGRPGYGTEGRTLVLLGQPMDESTRQARARYFSIVNELQNPKNAIDDETNERSPIAALINNLEQQWQRLTSSNSTQEFLAWLEQIAPLGFDFDIIDEAEIQIIQSLDTLDSVILAAIAEIEQLSTEVLSSNDLEERLRLIWRRTFAYFTHQEESRLEEYFLHRGIALRQTIYPDQTHRRRLYRTSLPPRAGNDLLNTYSSIRDNLELGEQYADWNSEQRFEYLRTIIERISSLQRFNLAPGPGRGESRPPWHEILRWWLNPGSAPKTPTSTQISRWHNYINNNFYYRFNWGLGCVISLAMDDVFGEDVRQLPTLEDWPRTGLPWIVFWMKELIVWGTLDPVAAYLLARSVYVTRPEAEEAARAYYENQSQTQTRDEILNAMSIRNWVNEQMRRDESKSLPTLAPLVVELLRDFKASSRNRWRVVPVEVGEDIRWTDPAGFPLAICRKPDSWRSDYLNSHDFELDSEKRIVVSESYISY